MPEVRVWAPRARDVTLQIGSASLDMKPSSSGWWEVQTPLARQGEDYAFSLDDGPPLPDPRSPWQPYGVHGRSRFMDHSRYEWRDEGWQPPLLASGLIYEIHVGTFSAQGTFGGVVGHLDHLVDLGVTHVELMPVNSFSGTRGWGYDGVDLYAPHEPYGGPEGLKELVDACHARGLAVILDVVYNHFGPEGNYLERFGPYLSDRYRVPWGGAVNLDGPGSDEVRRFFFDNAVMWLRDYHMDGLRIDAVHAIFDQSALHFLEELQEVVGRLDNVLGRHLSLIAESDLNNPRLIQAREIGGYGLAAQWNDDFHHAVHALLTGERDGYYVDFGSLRDLAKAFSEGFVYDGRYSDHRGRTHGRPLRGVTGSRLVAFIQNHDQVGNRAKGERLSQLVSTQRLMMAAALLLTSPFIPLLFQGEEWGASTPFRYFTDHGDEGLGEAVRDGRRREFAAFGWRAEDVPDPQAEETFAVSRLDWEEKGRRPHREILDWYQRLIRLRRDSAVLLDGALDRAMADFDESERWLSLWRGRIGLVINLAEREQWVPCPGMERCEVLLSSHPDAGERRDGAILLPAEAVVVLQREDRDRS